MTNNDFPRLCGGTFFTLVLQALKPCMKAREHYDGDNDGLSAPDVFVGLFRVINPDYQEPKKGPLKGKTNDYKVVLHDMDAFVDRFIDTATVAKKDVRPVKALLDLIEKDEKIGTETEFYIQKDGSKIKKAGIFQRFYLVCGIMP